MKKNVQGVVWMRCKKIIKSISLLLLSVAMPSMAEDYNILVKNETTKNSGANLYVQVQTTGARTGIGGGRTQTSRCTALSSYEDGSFYLSQAMEEAQKPKITFYTSNNCRANTSIGSISPLAGTEPAASDLIITITDTGVSQANSPTPITAPTATQPGGDTRPGTNPTDPHPAASKHKLIRFFAPWTNTSAIIYVAGGDSAKMTSVKNYCGWFETRITPPEGSFQVYFKQTIGYTYVSDIIYERTNPATQGAYLTLDEVAANADTIWVKATKNGATTVTAKYPGTLGDCPTKKLPVMMFDWLHGNKGDGDVKTSIDRRDSTKVTTTYANGAKDQDPDFGPIYATSDDFGSGGCGGSNAKDSKGKGYMAGMVEQTLGPNGVPVRATNFPENCKITEHLNQWFLPQVVAEKGGETYSNATCRSIELVLDSNGLWLGQKDNKSTEGGLFLLDDFQYLDAEQTIKNPFYDNISSGGKRHNYGFTMKIQATFEYIPGQYFEFFGDDDVWVFINNRLVVDIGGQHQQVLGAVDLDTLGLEEGHNYPFHIFYAERHVSESNFMMRTSIDLKTEASLFYEDLSANGILNYEIYQIIRKQALSCDFSNSSTTKDTARAPSNFTLFGSGAYAEGVALDSVGTWFGGITIKQNYTGFTINTEEIRQKRTLPPGTYQLQFSLQTDESQNDDIWFTIDKYDSPTINFARVDDKNKWTLIGNDVDGTVDTLGKWVNTRYTVNIAFVEDWATFDDMVYVNTSNTALIPCDENGNRISTVTMKNGKGTFYVKATAPVQDVTLIVGSSDETQKAYWRHISFMEPPVPQVVFACIFDRDGDGRGDSVYAKLSKPAGRIDANLVQMDSVTLEFGEKFAAVKKENIKTNDADSTMTITSPGAGGFGTVPFTGGAETIYSGKITPFWRYQGSPINLTSDLTDSIGPVITAADISYSDDGSTVLSLTFSEGLDCESDLDAKYFRYYFKSTNTQNDDVAPDIFSKESKSKWRLIFRASNEKKDYIPVMGDSIRMIEGVHRDLLHRSTDPRNPFVRIAGEQNVVVTSAPVVTIGEKEESREIIRSQNPTIPKVIHPDKPVTAKEVAEEFGAQGHYLGDLSLSSMVNDEITNIKSEIKNASAKILEKDGLTLEQAISMENGNLDAVNKKYNLGDEIMNAYHSEAISIQQIIEISQGNSATTAEVTKELAKKTTLEYQTMYFTSLGVFVNSTKGSFSCIDTVYNGNCLDGNNDGKLFLAWNMKSKEGRMVGTGVYIARLSYKIRIGNKVVVNRTQDFLWGVRHGKTQGFTVDLN